MKKKNLKLDELNVVSFTTSAAKSLKGGTSDQESDNCHSWYNGRPVLCRPPLETTDCGGN